MCLFVEICKKHTFFDTSKDYAYNAIHAHQCPLKAQQERNFSKT